MELITMLKEFHFLYPWWLIALLPLWALAAWFGWRRQSGNWAQLIDADLLPVLRLSGGEVRRSPWLLIVLAWTLAVLALAGPAWQREHSAAWRSPGAWVLALDLSPSMAASDLAPDRATRARYALSDLLAAVRDERVALLAFAGESHTVTPLTEDVATVRALLPPLAPDLMPESGDNAAPALQEAARLIQAAGLHKGDVILLSDGFADQAAAMTAAQVLRKQGLRLHVVGVGSVQGAPLPDAQGQFVNDAQGHKVLAKLPEDSLRRLASLGGGDYVSLVELPQLLARLQAAAPQSLSGEQAEAGKALSHWQNGGVWLLAPLLLLCALIARKGWL